MSKFKVQLAFLTDIATSFGRGPFPDFVDLGNPPQLGDQVRFKGHTFVIRARLWNLDITPPTLVLTLDPQESPSGSQEKPM